MSAQASSTVERLRRLFGRAGGKESMRDKAAAQATARLDAIEQRLSELAQGMQLLQASMESAAQTTPALLQEALAALEKHISRAGREQFKANSLAEAQLDRLTSALDDLRAAEARRDAEASALHARNHAAEAAARLGVVQAILPALDGLDEALRAGRRVLDQPATPPVPVSAPTFMDRLLGRTAAPGGADAHAGALRGDMSAWLDGATFVRQRLLDILTAEGVERIAAEGQSFDPHHHIALEVVPATETLPPGTVAAELRAGYLAGDRVLRHAEVSVAKQMDNMGECA